MILHQEINILFVFMIIFIENIMFMYHNSDE